MNVIRRVDMTIKKDDSPDAVQAGQNIVNSTAAMAPGAQAIIRFTVKVNAGFGTGAIQNVATVSALNGQTNLDPNPDNNTASETTSVGPFADLQPTKTATPASVTAGGPAPGSGQINYAISYRNNGPSDASGVVITDTIQANLAASGVINAPGLSCNGQAALPGVQFACTPNAGAFGNAGPSDAVNVKITDNIPANTTYQTPASPFTVLAVGGPFTGANSVKLECAVTGGNLLTCVPKGNGGLTPNQTTSFLASDLDPGNRGYFIAIAVDCETGLSRLLHFLWIRLVI